MAAQLTPPSPASASSMTDAMITVAAIAPVVVLSLLLFLSMLLYLPNSCFQVATCAAVMRDVLVSAQVKHRGMDFAPLSQKKTA
jgi:hypothetical protein